MRCRVRGGPLALRVTPTVTDARTRRRRAAGAQPGAEVATAGGAPAGTLLAVEGALGLAHLKLAPALAAAAGGPGLRLGGGGGVTPVRPVWWPPEWGHEEEAAPAAGS